MSLRCSGSCSVQTSFIRFSCPCNCSEGWEAAPGNRESKWPFTRLGPPAPPPPRRATPEVSCLVFSFLTEVFALPGGPSRYATTDQAPHAETVDGKLLQVLASSLAHPFWLQVRVRERERGRETESESESERGRASIHPFIHSFIHSSIHPSTLSFMSCHFMPCHLISFHSLID